MNKLPKVLLQNIIEFLTITEIFGSFIKVCKILNTLFNSPYILNSLLSLHINTCHQTSLSTSVCLSYIKKIHKKRTLSH